MSPTRLPKPVRIRTIRRLFSNPLSAATAISFSLTFVGAGIALLLGYLPPSLPLGGEAVETGVVLLVVPLFALMLAILVEVTRSVLQETAPTPRRENPLAAWKPGQGEG